MGWRFLPQYCESCGQKATVKRFNFSDSTVDAIHLCQRCHPWYQERRAKELAVLRAILQAKKQRQRELACVRNTTKSTGGGDRTG